MAALSDNTGEKQCHFTLCPIVRPGGSAGTAVQLPDVENGIREKLAVGCFNGAGSGYNDGGWKRLPDRVE
jgi:hypothetical protein